MVHNLPANAGDVRDVGLIPASGKVSWRRAWEPTPVFFQENPMDRGVWQATIHRVAKSQTRLKQLSIHTGTHHIRHLISAKREATGMRSPRKTTTE